MRQFAAYILIFVGSLMALEACIGIADWIGCAATSGFAACGGTRRAAQETLRGLIALGLGLLYQNQKQEQS